MATATPKPEVEPVRDDGPPPPHANLATALAAFQANLPTVAKGQTARIAGREGRTGYTYDYADLTDVSAATLPALARQGLAWVTALDTAADNSLVLKWSLIHGASEEALSGTVPVGRAGQDWQSLGSAITYARRYCLVAVTGVAPGGDDNDGAGASAGAAPERQAPPRLAPTAPIETRRELLPPGLYDLATLTDYDACRAMFLRARAAGHLNFIIGVTGEDGTVVETPFGKYLQDLGATFTSPEVAEEAERAAVAAHEAAMAAREARGEEADLATSEAADHD
jgi:hypothetical protein